MIISNNQVKNALKVYSEQGKFINRAAKQEKSGASLKPDEVILSSHAQEFSQVLQSAKNVPEVQQERVERLSKAIAEGSYQVDAKDIAEKVLRHLDNN